MKLGPYSAANHVADALVNQHGRTGRHNWVTTNWDLWHDDHFSPEALRALREQLPMAIRADEGVRTLENILSLPATPQVVISTQDLAARRDYAVQSRYRPERRTNLDKHARPKLASEFKAPEGELETKIAAVFSELLGIDQIGRDDDFFELGGDSLSAVWAASYIQEIVPEGSAAPSLFDATTVRDIALTLAQAST